MIKKREVSLQVLFSLGWDHKREKIMKFQICKSVISEMIPVNFLIMNILVVILPGYLPMDCVAVYNHRDAA